MTIDININKVLTLMTIAININDNRYYFSVWHTLCTWQKPHLHNYYSNAYELL